MSQPESHPDLVRMMEAGILDGVFPGGALLVNVRGNAALLALLALPAVYFMTRAEEQAQLTAICTPKSAPRPWRFRL